MEKKERDYKAHCLVLPYPSQGDINPMLQFSKVLQHKGLKITLVTTHHVHSTMHRLPSTSIAFETISDGYDEGGILQAETIEAYLDSFQKVGTNTLIELLGKLSGSGNPVDCIVYDAFMPWPLDVAKKFGIVGAVSSLSLVRWTTFATMSNKDCSNFLCLLTLKFCFLDCHHFSPQTCLLSSMFLGRTRLSSRWLWMTSSLMLTKLIGSSATHFMSKLVKIYSDMASSKERDSSTHNVL